MTSAPAPVGDPPLSRGRLHRPDAVRVLALASVVVGGIALGPVAVALLGLVLAATVLTRVLDAPVALDVTFCTTLLAAAWAGLLGLYEAVSWLDVVMHTCATGACAAVAYVAVVRTGLVAGPADLTRPRLGVVVATTALGAALAVAWEIAEWGGHRFLDAGIYVGYDDTIGDLAAGVLGSVAAGMLVARRGVRGVG